MSKTRTAWITYTALRLLFFAVPFAILYLLGIWPWLSAVFAALIGVSLSVIFLSRPRATASESIYEWRNRDRTADDIVEDDAIDSLQAQRVEAQESRDAAADAELDEYPPRDPQLQRPLPGTEGDADADPRGPRTEG